MQPRMREYYVKEIEFGAPGHPDHNLIQFFVNADNEPIFFPDRALSFLFHVNLSTLRGRFNRINKKKDGNRILISEKSKFKLSDTHYINWDKIIRLNNNSNQTILNKNNNPNKSNIQASSSTSIPFENDGSSTSTSPEHNSPSLNSSTPLHGLVALNHVKLVNRALTDWIASNYERLGTSIQTIVDNFESYEIPFTRNGDILSISINNREDQEPPPYAFHPYSAPPSPQLSPYPFMFNNSHPLSCDDDSEDEIQNLPTLQSIFDSSTSKSPINIPLNYKNYTINYNMENQPHQQQQQQQYIKKIDQSSFHPYKPNNIQPNTNTNNNTNYSKSPIRNNSPNNIKSPQTNYKPSDIHENNFIYESNTPSFYRNTISISPTNFNSKTNQQPISPQPRETQYQLSPIMETSSNPSSIFPHPLQSQSYYPQSQIFDLNKYRQLQKPPPSPKSRPFYHYNSEPSLSIYQNQLKLRNNNPTSNNININNIIYNNIIECFLENGSISGDIDLNSINGFEDLKRKLIEIFNLSSFSIIATKRSSSPSPLYDFNCLPKYDDILINHNDLTNKHNESWKEFSKTVKRIIIRPVNMTPDIKNLCN